MHIGFCGKPHLSARHGPRGLAYGGGRFAHGGNVHRSGFLRMVKLVIYCVAVAFSTCTPYSELTVSPSLPDQIQNLDTGAEALVFRTSSEGLDRVADRSRLMRSRATTRVLGRTMSRACVNLVVLLAHSAPCPMCVCVCVCVCVCETVFARKHSGAFLSRDIRPWTGTYRIRCR